MISVYERFDGVRFTVWEIPGTSGLAALSPAPAPQCLIDQASTEHRGYIQVTEGRTAPLIPGKFVCYHFREGKALILGVMSPEELNRYATLCETQITLGDATITHRPACDDYPEQFELEHSYGIFDIKREDLIRFIDDIQALFEDNPSRFRKPQGDHS